jgi:carbonic anhydrase
LLARLLPCGNQAAHRQILEVRPDLSVLPLAAATGDSSPAPMRFFGYKDPEQNAREQIRMVRSHPWFAKEIPVRGFVFDMETGLLSEVDAVPQQNAA